MSVAEPLPVVAPVLIRQMLTGCRILSMHGHDDFNQGQFSARTTDRERFVIKSAMTGFDGAMSDDLITCPVARAQSLDRKAPPETPLHQAIYACRSDVGAIVHSHPENAIVFGATDLEIEPLSHEGAFFQGRVARFSETTHTILEHDSADAVARSLGHNPAVFLRNHGFVVVAKTARQAVVQTLMLERACKLQLMAVSSGQPYHVTRPDEVEAKRRYIYSDVAIKSYWDHAAAAARRTFPELEGI